MSSERTLFALTALLLLAAAPAEAAPRPSRSPTASPLAPDTARRVVAAIADELRRSYVFPDKVPAIVRKLEQAHSGGRYAVTSPGALAERLTEDLQAASGDKHLGVFHDPARHAAVQRQAAAPAADREDADAYWRDMALREHHGLADMRVLAGNIRYLRITAFHWARDETGLAYDGAMRFIRGGDAAIIDLRGNGGGSHAAVRYLVSHFMDEARLLLTFLKGSEPPEQSRTLEHLPAGRLKGKPLYVLVDERVASAGEDFAYAVQQFKLGELVGATTAGAANNNRFVPVAPGFVFSVSEGRPVHPVSQTNWEGVGVKPDVAVAPGEALDVAQARALERLARTPGTTPARLAEYAWARAGVNARLHPVTVPQARLKALAGRYGAIAVTWRDGALWFQRPGRAARRLSPLDADGLFAVEDSERLRVRFTPRELQLHRRDEPEPQVHPRE
jgi:hypothetical protein